MTKHLVRLHHTTTARAQQVLARRESGQGALEYIGMLIIIGVIVAAVITIISGQQGTITSAVSTAISNFLSGGN